ncbi:MAG: BamA/TamA family outer membrane protein [Chitinophagaceae bacterium]
MAQDSIKTRKNYKIAAFPIAFYSPETSVGIGGLGTVTFRKKKNLAQQYPSQVSFGAALTFEKQLLLYIPFRIYLRNDQFLTYGEVGYYKYSYYFYGIGNAQATDYRELYKVNFPRIKINALIKARENLFFGLRYWFENFKIKETEPGKQLATDNTIVGRTGSTVSGIGPVINYDSRDNIFYPTRGIFLDAAVQFYRPLTGSNFEYTRYTTDFSFYIPGKRNRVWAFNVFGDFIDGIVPFNQLAFLGSNKKMRGFYEGRFRDKNSLILGGEYRFPVYKRFGAVAFANAGAVNKNLTDLPSYIRTSYGAGIRYALNPKEKINIRIDAAFGKNTSGFYFTIGEAF